MGPIILLIDDSAILRRIATNVLGTHTVHCEVLTATRATEGFARACGTRPDLILIDAQLAGTAKAELCQRFLDEPRTANVPMVLLLGRGVPVPRLVDLPANIVDTLSKPFTPEQLVSSVKAILGAAREDANFASVRACLRGERHHEPSNFVDRHGVSVTTAPSSPAAPQNGPAQHGLAPFFSRENDDSKLDGDGVLRVRRVTPAVGSLRAVLQTVVAEKGSGRLSIVLPDRPRLELYFDTGCLLVVTTRDADGYSEGASEVLPPKVSPATLEAAVDEQRNGGVPFFLTLGARGQLSKAAAVELVHQFGQRYFSQVWGLRPAAIRCEFASLDALPGFALRLEPRRESIDEWLLASLRGVTSENIAATARHDGFVGTPTCFRNGQTLLNFLELTTQEKEFVRRVNGRLDLPEIAKGMGIPAEQAFLLLHRFRMLEIMDYRPAPPAYVVTPRTSVRRVLPLQN